MKTNVKRGSSLVLLFLAVVVLTSHRTPAQRYCGEDNVWLTWSEEQQQAYFFGYSAGYSNGLNHGCLTGWGFAATDGTIKEFPLEQCLQKDVASFSESEDYYVKGVTDFYLGHPEVGDIVPYEVLDLLGKGLTVEQIRNYPFPRHAPCLLQEPIVR